MRYLLKMIVWNFEFICRLSGIISDKYNNLLIILEKKHRWIAGCIFYLFTIIPDSIYIGVGLASFYFFFFIFLYLMKGCHYLKKKNPKNKYYIIFYDFFYRAAHNMYDQIELILIPDEYFLDTKYGGHRGTRAPYKGRR